MSYIPNDRAVEMQMAVLKIKSTPEWHPRDVNAINYGFQTGIRVGLAYIKSGLSSYCSEVSKMVEHLDDSWGLARIMDEMNRVAGRSFIVTLPGLFVEPLYGTGPRKQCYFDGFEIGYQWIVDLLNAYMSYDILKGDAISMVFEYIKKIESSLVFE